MHLMVLGASRPSACCPLSRLGKRAPDRHWPKSALGQGRTPPIKADFAQFSQGSPPTGLPGLRTTRCRRGHADPGVRAVFFGYQCAGVGREPGSPGSQTAGRAERASSQDWAPQSFPLGEAVTVLPEGPWWPGWWVWPAGAAVTGGTGW